MDFEKLHMNLVGSRKNRGALSEFESVSKILFVGAKSDRDDSVILRMENTGASYRQKVRVLTRENSSARALRR